MVDYFKNIIARYYYFVIENGEGTIICNPLCYETQDNMKRFESIQTTKDFINIRGVTYVKPDVIVDETNIKIVIPHLFTNNLYCIKYILKHIYEHGGVSKDTSIVINKFNTKQSDSNLLSEIFTNTNIEFLYEANEQMTIKMCNFMQYCAYRFHSVVAIISDREEFTLKNSCKKLSSNNIHNFIFYKILHDNTNLKEVRITKLIANEVYRVDSIHLNNLISIEIQEIDLFSTRNNENIISCAQYMYNVLSYHRQSLKSIIIRCKLSVLIWNIMCSQNLKWPKLNKMIIFSGHESQPLAIPKKMSNFPFLTEFNIQTLSKLYPPHMKCVCISHMEIYDSHYEALAILIAKNKKYIKATITWLILCKLYFKNYNICKDIALKIAHMVVEDDVFYYDKAMNLTCSDFITNTLPCTSNQFPSCDIVMFVTSSQIKEWKQINFKKTHLDSAIKQEYTLKLDIKKDNDNIAKKLEQIDDIKDKLDKKRDKLERLENTISEHNNTLSKMVKRIKK